MAVRKKTHSSSNRAPANARLLDGVRAELRVFGETLRDEIHKEVSGLRTEMNRRFEQVDLRFDRMAADLAILKTDVALLKDDVSLLKTDVALLKTDVSLLKDDFSLMKTDVALLKTDVTLLKNAALDTHGEVKKLARSLEHKVNRDELVAAGVLSK